MALALASVGCAALAALLWLMGATPCGWGMTLESRSCSSSPTVIVSLATIPAVIVGAVVSCLTRRLRYFFVGMALTFGPLVLTWLAISEFPFAMNTLGVPSGFESLRPH